mmetsp:Transcript_41565/g.79425  ORF Transcript_41565/g.79425 Transcript_41565/m.79425 type:complete len:104 (-) Transcript_41565:1782-2093(-)
MALAQNVNQAEVTLSHRIKEGLVQTQLHNQFAMMAPFLRLVTLLGLPVADLKVLVALLTMCPMVLVELKPNRIPDHRCHQFALQLHARTTAPPTLFSETTRTT